MKTIIKKIVGRGLSIIAHASPAYYKKIDEITAVDKGVQILLSLKYKELRERGGPFLAFEDVEFRAFSQNGEDGILLYIFSLIGTVNKMVVEICAGDGIECNAANLLINHGWGGLLFDGNEQAINNGRAFYSTCQDTFIHPPKFVHAWVTSENINSLIVDNNVVGEIDLLSIDLDGMDYWIWRAIECINPRVVVVEYQDAWGPEKAVTVTYEPEFKPHTIGYAGASLKAFVKLASEKGYRLVGCQRYGFNAFFVRHGLGDDILPAVPTATCFSHPRHQRDINTQLLNSYEWIEV